MSISNRYLFDAIEKDAFSKQKMVFISGPRQVGKTTLAKSFLSNSSNYFSYDEETFRRSWIKDPKAILSKREEGTVVLDEIHKDRAWKRKLKGLFDSAEVDKFCQYIITGSAKLDFYRRGSDSLMGRYLPYRLHPFSVAEDLKNVSPDHLFETQGRVNFKLVDLLNLSGFPEPLFSGLSSQAKRWSRLRLERLVQEDARDLLNISDLRSFQNLIELLPERVGSQFSINAIKEEVGKAYATVRSWYQILETLYFSFSIKPYSKKISRSLRAEPRMFLFDILRIPSELQAKRLENLTALHLLKACNYWTDTAQGEFTLTYVRDKSQREVDFLILNDAKPWMLIECKSGDREISKNLKYFSEILNPKHNIQLVNQSDYEKYYPAYKTRVISYEKFFAQLV
jgi:predicted AAA+ superfamily ATPase